MSTTTSYTQPAIVGGLFMGVLSALPIVAAGNLCCCLWIVSGGLVAAYLLQQNQPAPITNGDGAIAGLLAGLCGAVVHLVVSIPVTLLTEPMQRRMMERLIERTNSMPPEFRQFMTSYTGGAVGIVLNFIFFLCIGSIFATLGGLLGAVFFRKPGGAPPDAPHAS